MLFGGVGFGAGISFGVLVVDVIIVDVLFFVWSSLD